MFAVVDTVIELRGEMRANCTGHIIRQENPDGYFYLVKAHKREYSTQFFFSQETVRQEN